MPQETESGAMYTVLSLPLLEVATSDRREEIILLAR